MKKSLLLCAALFASVAANAQTEKAFVDAVAVLGEEAADTKVAVTAGTVFCESQNVKMTAAYDCEYKIVAMYGDSDPYNTITVAGEEIFKPVKGIQGQTNPTNTKDAATQQPVDNAIFRFDVKQDGILYVVSKLTFNKTYYVFEGEYSAATPSTMVAYYWGATNVKNEKFLDFQLKADKDGYYVAGSGQDDKTTGIYWPCHLVGLESVNGTVDDNGDISKANGLGVIAFPVYAEAGTYYVHAVGSKITVDGFVFVPGAKEVVKPSTSKQENASGGSSEPAASNTVLKITCPEGKANAWDSQIVINFPKALEKKAYTLTMDVKGSVALEPKQGQYGWEAIQPVAQDNNSDNKDQWGGPADLQYMSHFTATTEWVKGVKDPDGKELALDGNFPYSRVLLNLGGYAGDLYIDNVRVIDETGKDVFCIGFETAEEQALVENCWMNLAKEFVVESSTGISNVSADAACGVAYDLFGRAGATSGLMIKNGKKVYQIK